MIGRKVISLHLLLIVIMLSGFYSAHIDHHQPEIKDLLYATNSSGGWTVTTLAASGDTGFYPSICIDSVNKVHISYHDKTHGSLKFNCNFNGRWIGNTVDDS